MCVCDASIVRTTLRVVYGLNQDAYIHTVHIYIFLCGRKYKIRFGHEYEHEAFFIFPTNQSGYPSLRSRGTKNLEAVVVGRLDYSCPPARISMAVVARRKSAGSNTWEPHKTISTDRLSSAKQVVPASPLSSRRYRLKIILPCIVARPSYHAALTSSSASSTSFERSRYDTQKA